MRHVVHRNGLEERVGPSDVGVTHGNFSSFGHRLQVSALAA